MGKYKFYVVKRSQKFEIKVYFDNDKLKIFKKHLEVISLLNFKVSFISPKIKFVILKN